MLHVPVPRRSGRLEEDGAFHTPDWQERQHAKAEAMGTLLTPMAAFEFPVPGWAGPVTDEKEHQP